MKKKQILESGDPEKDPKVNQLQGELAQMKIASSQMMEQLDREAERVKSDLEEARKRSRIAGKEMDDLRREMAQLQNELNVTKAERDELVTKVHSLRRQVADYGMPDESDKKSRILGRLSKGSSQFKKDSLTSGNDSEEIESEREQQAPEEEGSSIEYNTAATQELDGLFYQANIDTEIVMVETEADKQKKPSSNRSTWLKTAGVIGVIGVVMGVVVGLSSRQTPQEVAVPTKIEVISDDVITPEAEAEPEPEPEPEPVGQQNDQSESEQADVETSHAQEVQVLEKNAGLIKKARTLIRRKKYRQAVKLLGRYIKKHPKDAQLRFLQGIALHRTRLLKSSVYQLKKAVELDPTMAEAYYRLGYVYLETKQKKKACRVLKQFLRIDSSKRRFSRVKNELRKQRCM